jgi:hypothetical protein
MGTAEWECKGEECRAAWSLYVELVTRVTIEPLGDEKGLLREALTSLYSLFESTRQILREAGPDVGASKKSVGGIAIGVLNRGLRPFLTEWHPRLKDWESQRATGVSPKEHEDRWPDASRLRQGLIELQRELKKYAQALELIVGLEPQS